jgi:DNA repair protein RecO (recombination protein O)
MKNAPASAAIGCVWAPPCRFSGWGGAVQWSDDAIVLSLRRHGETASIVSLLTRDRGRHPGLVHGQGGGRRAALQPGATLQATWRSRLADNLGTVTCEGVASPDPRILYDRPRLATLSAFCAVVDTALGEREPAPGVYEGSAALLTALADRDDWPVVYIAWEIKLLSVLGFGLDLARCAVTGGTGDLAFVSPRTGRAVTREAGLPYGERLLPLPAFLHDTGLGDPAVAAAPDDLAAGLRLTGHFLERHVYAARHRPMPSARARLPASWAGQGAPPPPEG